MFCSGIRNSVGRTLIMLRDVATPHSLPVFVVLSLIFFLSRNLRDIFFFASPHSTDFIVILSNAIKIKSGDLFAGMTSLDTALHCLIVSFLWGATNPLIKKSTAGIIKVKASNPADRFVNEIKYLLANWKYVVLFLINQLGSVLYFVLLQSVDLSVIVPTVNALTFIITGFVGLLIGESTPSIRTLLGVILILTGITFCVLDRGTTILGT